MTCKTENKAAQFPPNLEPVSEEQLTKLAVSMMVRIHELENERKVWFMERDALTAELEHAKALLWKEVRIGQTTKSYDAICQFLGRRPQ